MDYDKYIKLKEDLTALEAAIDNVVNSEELMDLRYHLKKNAEKEADDFIGLLFKTRNYVKSRKPSK